MAQPRSHSLEGAEARCEPRQKAPLCCSHTRVAFTDIPGRGRMLHQCTHACTPERTPGHHQSRTLQEAHSQTQPRSQSGTDTDIRGHATAETCETRTEKQRQAHASTRTKVETQSRIVTQKIHSHAHTRAQPHTGTVPSTALTPQSHTHNYTLSQTHTT